MDKTFSPSYDPSQITYVEAEAVGFSRFHFRRKRIASTASASSFRFHIPGANTIKNTLPFRNPEVPAGRII